MFHAVQEDERTGLHRAALIEEFGAGHRIVELHALCNAVEFFAGVELGSIPQGAIDDDAESQLVRHVLQDQDHRAGKGGILEAER